MYSVVRIIATKVRLRKIFPVFCQSLSDRTTLKKKKLPGTDNTNNFPRPLVLDSGTEIALGALRRKGRYTDIQ